MRAFTIKQRRMDMAVRKLTTTGKGNSYYVTIPKKIIQNLNWRKGQRVVIEQDNESVVIRDWKED